MPVLTSKFLFQTSVLIIDFQFRKIGVPLYGSENNWNGKLAKKSKEIKDNDFKHKVTACERINRTLVYKRNNPMAAFTTEQ